MAKKEIFNKSIMICRNICVFMTFVEKQVGETTEMIKYKVNKKINIKNINNYNQKIPYKFNQAEIRIDKQGSNSVEDCRYQSYI